MDNFVFLLKIVKKYQFILEMVGVFTQNWVKMIKIGLYNQVGLCLACATKFFIFRLGGPLPLKWGRTSVTGEISNFRVFDPHWYANLKALEGSEVIFFVIKMFSGKRRYFFKKYSNRFVDFWRSYEPITDQRRISVFGRFLGVPVGPSGTPL